MLLWIIFRVERHKVDDDVQISALDAFYEKDGRRSRYIGECWSGIEEKMPEISREVNEMNWLRIGYASTLSRGKISKVNPKILMDEKSWKTWKNNQKIVMNEELVQNVVMDEELIQHIVMDEELIQNGVMDENS